MLEYWGVCKAYRDSAEIHRIYGASISLRKVYGVYVGLHQVRLGFERRDLTSLEKSIQKLSSP